MICIADSLTSGRANSDDVSLSSARTGSLAPRKDEVRRKNGAYGVSDIEGKVAMVATSKRGERASFN
jgi:hypothetical protein